MKKSVKKLVVKLAVMAALFGIAAEVGAQTVAACCWRPCRPCGSTTTVYQPKKQKIEAPTVYSLVSGATVIRGKARPGYAVVVQISDTKHSAMASSRVVKSGVDGEWSIDLKNFQHPLIKTIKTTTVVRVLQRNSYYESDYDELHVYTF